ncbi:BTAD domain-containing putative transcriptional regulator [Streptomyces sp. NPDC056661]|uniref:AfsR/SARP family transcriptional regulator n=1 Tax=Streptomyces sp. NPDC056661 TaxID=3345898 RepID=UPI0036B33F7E
MSERHIGLANGQPDGLTVRVIGGLTVCVAGQPLAPADIGSRKGRVVLAMLAIHKRHVHIGDLSSAVWGERPPANPSAGIATLVSRLRSKLGANAVVGSRAAGYRLGAHVRVDLFRAADLLSDAHTALAADAPGNALAIGHQALQLLDRGDILADYPDVLWADSQSTLHGHLLRQARHLVIDAALPSGDLRTAQMVAEDAIAADSLDELAGRQLMRAYRRNGEPGRALAVYERLRAALASELGVSPSPETRAIHAETLRCNAASRPADGLRQELWSA